MAKPGVFIKATRGTILTLDLAISLLSRCRDKFSHGIYRRSIVYNRLIDYSRTRAEASFLVNALISLLSPFFANSRVNAQKGSQFERFASWHYWLN